MATGDAADFSARLRGLLPGGWFPASPAVQYSDPDGVPFTDQTGDTLVDATGTLIDDAILFTPTGAEAAPVLAGVLAGFASVFAWVWTVLVYIRAQTRIATATGAWLDGRAADFLPSTFQRRAGEQDAVFSARARREIMRPRVTRAALSQVVSDLTGNVPKIFEPWNATDTGGYGFLGMTLGTGLAYGGATVAGAGGYGSLLLPYQVFVTTTPDGVGGIPSVAGYYTGIGWAGGGYGVGAIEWADLGMSVGQISNADIFAAIVEVLPAAATAWVSFGQQPGSGEQSGGGSSTPGFNPLGGTARLGQFILDVNILAQ